MEEYTIYCTPEQTKKALELGAPIVLRSEYYEPQKHDFKLDTPIPCKQYTNGYCVASCPTAEQMLGWLNEQGVQITTHVDVFSEWKTYLYKASSVGIIAESEWRKSRKEAITDAIDEALKYLTKAKEEHL